MNTVLLTVAYDGRPYAGFVEQKEVTTVAGVLLHALRELDPTIARLRAVSRTDAGVHAHAQRVAFDTERSLPMRGWVLGVAKHLPETVAVRRAALAPAGYDPRQHAVSKRYRYLLHTEPVNDPLLAGRAWRVEGIDRAALQRELDAAVGTHDFAGFCSAQDERQNTVRTILSAEMMPPTESLVVVDVVGTGFLHRMVRILIGTVVDVARGRLDPGAVARALESRDRRDGGITAPPDGLYLEEVTLADEPLSDCWP